MADFIKREDALAFIKNLYPGIPFTKVARQRWHEENCAYMQCERAVESIPAADVVEAVRCSECKLHDNCYTEDVFKFAKLNDDRRFCGVGKRKGGDE